MHAFRIRQRDIILNTREQTALDRGRTERNSLTYDLHLYRDALRAMVVAYSHVKVNGQFSRGGASLCCEIDRYIEMATVF